MRSLAAFYLANMKIAIVIQFQYRVANLFYMIGMIAEPIVYLVVWSTVASTQGGSVAGFTGGDFAAYYIVWTLVRNMNIVLTPFAWEQRIKGGELSGQLLRPMHPIHNDLSYFAGWKVVAIAMWLPIAAALTLIFQPTLNTTLFDAVAFFFALWGGFLVRFFLLWLLGLITFWTTRISAIFELYFTLELLLSGRLVPLALLPDWARQIANFLPFQWAFGFPIEVLLGRLTPTQVLVGLGAQLFWITIGALLVAIFWRASVRRFASVGG